MVAVARTPRVAIALASSRSGSCERRKRPMRRSYPAAADRHGCDGPRAAAARDGAALRVLAWAQSFVHPDLEVSMSSRRSLRSHALVALAAAGLASSVAAVAAIPGGDGTISGCYKVGGHNPGVLRVVDAEAGQHCRSSETPISWNQTGPQGPPGQGFSFHRVVVVHGDGTPAENGAALRDALSSHQGSDADERVLISLEPGRYDTGSGTLPLGPWTDLQGSGAADTTIVGEAPSNGTLLRPSTSLQIADVTIDAANASQNAAVVI